MELRVTTYHTRPEYLALLATVCERPEDDAPRLILSDWLEEHGEDERAEFIRVQIGLANHIKQVETERANGAQYHNGPDRYRRDLENKQGLLWIGNRDPWFLNGSKFDAVSLFGIPYSGGVHAFVGCGFVSEIRLTCREFMGGECNGCGGVGYVHGPISFPNCRTCKGTGRTPGVARELFKRHPIVTVRLVDAKPSIRSVYGFPTVYVWESNQVPELIFRCYYDEVTGRDFPSEAAALDALSDACVAYGRSLAGLPALEAVRV